MITYEIRKGKYIICKDSVYFALTKEQVIELKKLLIRIIKNG